MQTTLYIKNHRKNWECCPVSLFNCHEFRFSIVRIVIDWPSHVFSSLWWIVSKVTSLCSLVKTLIVQWCQRDQPRDIELFWRAKMETKLVKIPLVLTNQNLCMNQHVACDFGVELSGNWKKKKVAERLSPIAQRYINFGLGCHHSWSQNLNFISLSWWTFKFRHQSLLQG